uniref:Uncharacterized protein n=1 Tax=Vespula pensylvanica TaxID=30213 RepID=A0A834PFR1_VESPE|nr:hypothetical protein H0235_000732 [Vespula pensylvanica]
MASHRFLVNPASHWAKLLRLQTRDRIPHSGWNVEKKQKRIEERARSQQQVSGDLRIRNGKKEGQFPRSTLSTSTMDFPEQDVRSEGKTAAKYVLNVDTGTPLSTCGYAISSATIGNKTIVD